MPDLGRPLLFSALSAVVVGCVLIVAKRYDLRLGRLPGDLRWRGRNWSISFPIASGLPISIVLSWRYGW